MGRSQYLPFVAVGLLSVVFPFIADGCGEDCEVRSTTGSGVILTFDDSAIEHWHQQRELFRRYGVRATFFVSSYQRLGERERAMIDELAADGHEIAAHSANHVPATSMSTNEYISTEVVPELDSMEKANLHPVSFAYPGGADVVETTAALFDHFDYVRDTSYYPNHDPAFVTCGHSTRYVGGLGIDYRYGVTDDEYFAAFDRAACEHSNLILYGHNIQTARAAQDYYIDPARLERLIQGASARGLQFRRMRDLCSWQVQFGGSAELQSVAHSPRRPDELHFADFTGDGRDDALRMNGTHWLLLRNTGAGFYLRDEDGPWEVVNNSPLRIDSVKFGDFNGDRRTDVLMTRDGAWYVSYSATGAWEHLNTSSVPLWQLKPGDFDGDGRTDIFHAENGSWNISYGGTSPWVKVRTLHICSDRYGFADFNGDGRTDVFVQANGRWWYSSAATGAWEFLNTSEYEATSLRFGDFNGDGRADVLRPDGSTWWVSWSGTQAWTVLRKSPDGIHDLAVADFNGDHWSDILRVGD